MTLGLAVFVKTPGRSPIKTRLWPAIGREAAEQLHLDCAAAVAASIAALERDGLVHPYWAVAEAEADGAVSSWTGWPCLAQGPGDLGERMARVSSRLIDRHGAALLVGADVPQLTPRDLQPALALLVDGRADVVLGPAEDGGFWLVGSRVALPIACWTTPRYGTACAREDFHTALPVGLRIVEIAALRDLDEPDDCAAVAAALAALPERTRAQERVWRRLHAVSGKLER